MTLDNERDQSDADGHRVAQHGTAPQGAPSPRSDEPPIKARLNLVGLDGNAFSIIGGVKQALRRAGATPEQLEQFQTEAMSGDYDNVLQTAMRWTESPDD